MGPGFSESTGIDANSSDRRLVQATLAGNDAALSLLHGRYYGRLFRLSLVRCRNAQDAEDIASETFVRLIGHLGSYKFQGESLFPYLARIAGNLIVDQGRRNRGVSFVSVDGAGVNDALRALIEGIPSTAPDPQQLVLRGEVRARVRAAIAMLPPDQGDAVLLRFGGDLPLKEIALALNKSEGAIKSLLHRALGNLRRSLAEGEDTSGVHGHLGATRGVDETVEWQGGTVRSRTRSDRG